MSFSLVYVLYMTLVGFHYYMKFLIALIVVEESLFSINISCAYKHIHLVLKVHYFFIKLEL